MMWMVDVSHKGAACIQNVGTPVLSTPALPAVPIPVGTTLTELSYRVVPGARISPSGSAALPVPEGLKTVIQKARLLLKFLLLRWLNLADSPASVLTTVYHCLSS
jgi:hypothetical protein